MTFETYVNYFESSVLSLAKISSQKSTRSRLKKFVEAFGDKELPLSNMDVQRFVSSLSTKYDAQTVQNLYSSFRAVLTRAKADGIIAEVPRPLLPKIEQKEQSWFTPEQMRTLSRYEPIYSFASETGARIGEILAIQIPDIDFENKMINIRRNIYDNVISTPKTRAGTRLISASNWLCGILKKECEGRGEGFVFTTSEGKPRNPDSAARKLQHACKVFDIPYAGWHGLRRGNCTILSTVIGAPEKIVAFRMGHSSLGITLGRYAKYLPGLDREYIDQLAEILQ